MRKLIFGCFVFFIYSRCFSQADDSLMIRHIADEILLHGKAYDNLHDLTKNIGARLTASPGFYKAEQWGLKTFQQSGADKSWLQECMVPHWLRGGRDEVIANMTTQKKNLDVIALGNSLGQHLGQCASRFSVVCCQAIHFKILRVADHQPLRGIEHTKALRHAVDGGAHLLVFLA